MPSLSKFIGDPVDLNTSYLPSRRGVLRFVDFERLRLKSVTGKKTPSNDSVFESVSLQLVALFKSRGFDSCSKRSVKRLVFVDCTSFLSRQIENFLP